MQQFHRSGYKYTYSTNTQSYVRTHTNTSTLLHRKGGKENEKPLKVRTWPELKSKLSHTIVCHRIRL